MKEKNKEPSPVHSQEDEKEIHPETPADANSDGKKHTQGKKAQEKIHRMEDQIQQLLKENSELQDKYLRSLAEMDNFRKRLIKEKEEYKKYLLSDFLLEILQVFDNLERALQAKSPKNEDVIISGVEYTVKQFADILKSLQVQEIDALKKPFDPSVHEALEKEENPDFTQETVVQVFQKGYLYQGRLLRPSLVKVAVPVLPNIEEESETPE